MFLLSLRVLPGAAPRRVRPQSLRSSSSLVRCSWARGLSDKSRFRTRAVHNGRHTGATVLRVETRSQKRRPFTRVPGFLWPSTTLGGGRSVSGRDLGSVSGGGRGSARSRSVLLHEEGLPQVPRREVEPLDLREPSVPRWRERRERLRLRDEEDTCPEGAPQAPSVLRVVRHTQRLRTRAVRRVGTGVRETGRYRRSGAASAPDDPGVSGNPRNRSSKNRAYCL